MLSHNGEIHGIDLLNSRLDRDWSKTFLEKVFAVSEIGPLNSSTGRELVFAMLSHNGEINELDLLNSSTGLKPFLKSPCPKLDEFKIKPVKFEHWAENDSKINSKESLRFHAITGMISELNPVKLAPFGAKFETGQELV